MARSPIGRQQLLEAARDELVRGNGVMELSALSHRSGLSTGALYHYFGSKSGLLVALYDAFYLGLDRAIGDARLPVDADWATRERERTRLFVDYHLADPLARVLLDRAAQGPQLTEREAAYIQKLNADAAINIRRGQKLGELPAEMDPDSAGAFVIGGLRHGIAHQLRINPPPDQDEATDRLWARTAAALGIAPPGRHGSTTRTGIPSRPSSATRQPPVHKLTARSAVLSALLAAHPVQAPASVILTMAALLGFQESAVRVALSRMVAAGDLERCEGTYRLSARLIEARHREGEALRPDIGAWDGHWHMAVVTTGTDDPAERVALREALRTAKFGEVREGVWARPANIEVRLGAREAQRMSLFTATPDESSLVMAERLFATRAWAATAEELAAVLEHGESLTDRFVAAAATVRHIFDDPLLPAELLPPTWPGARLRECYQAFGEELTALAQGLTASA